MGGQKIRSISKLSSRRVVNDPASTMGVGYNYDVLYQAQRCWDGLSEQRKRRKRNKRYLFGDQWGEYIKDPDNPNRSIREDEYIMRQGKVPLKQNLILRLVKSVMGQYRQNQTSSVCIARDRDESRLGEMMTSVLEYNSNINRIGVLDARSMMEFLISGAVFHKEFFGWKKGKKDVWTDNVSFNRIFFDNKMEDYRHFDCSIIGEVHDIKFMDVLQFFAKSKRDEEVLRGIYIQSERGDLLWNMAGNGTSKRVDDISFFTASDVGMCRVIEVWRKESKDRYECHDLLHGERYKIEIGDIGRIEQENARRVAEGVAAGMAVNDIPLIECEWMVDTFWKYYFLSPLGHVLSEGETPYSHGEHPYSFVLYPFIDGEIHSFVGDVVDQQRYLNRLITLFDFIMSSSAKGVLLVPESCLGDNSPEQFADQWTKFNGVIVYKPSANKEAPQQVSANSTNIGIFDIINLQLKFMEDISGVHGAMQGAAPSSGTAASLYAQQSANAVMSLVDILDSFKAFREDRDTKKVKMIRQYYTDKKMLGSINKGTGRVQIYDPSKVSNVEFDLVITESDKTPLYRMMANDFLIKLFDQGAISLEMLLTNGDFPNADNLLQQVEAMKEQMMQGQQAMGGVVAPGGGAPRMGQV